MRVCVCVCLTCSVYLRTLVQIGLGLLPLDGNLHRYAGVVAHASAVTALCSSADGSVVFSAGDGVVNMWLVRLKKSGSD